MTIWEGEIRELDKLYLSFKGHLPDIVKEMEQLIKTDDANVVMLYSRRALEVIVTDLCETELNRPRKTEPLKGIIDKLNSEEKVPAHIITSMHGLNSMATYGAHPKDFDPEQVKPVLNNLAIIIKWYLKHKDFHIVSKTEIKEERAESREERSEARQVKTEKIEKREERQARESVPPVRQKSRNRRRLLTAGIFLVIIIFFLVRTLITAARMKEQIPFMNIESYRTVQIGDQTWMAENLRTTFFNDGTPIRKVKNDKEWELMVTPAYCWYENDKKSYGSDYGALYNWYTVNTGKLCPAGWHVPTDKEWRTLTEFLGDSLTFFEGKLIPAHKEWKMITGLQGDSFAFGNYDEDKVASIPDVAAIKLKVAAGNYWTPVDMKEPFFDGSSYTYNFWVTDEYGYDTIKVCNYVDFDTILATDEYGFAALPGGDRTIYGLFWGFGDSGSWWSSTEVGPESGDARSRQMNSNSNGVSRIPQYMQTGMSVRCIKDQPVADRDHN